MKNSKNKLIYKKYKNVDSVITIDLNNGYTILALIGKYEIGNYGVELRIKENTVEKWDLIENAEHIIFDKNTKNIYSAILKTVSEYLDKGFFNHYIDRYEYDLKCFDIGNEIEESKRMDGADAS